MAEEVRLRFGVLVPEDDGPPTTKALENRVVKQQTQLSILKNGNANFSK